MTKFVDAIWNTLITVTDKRDDIIFDKSLKDTFTTSFKTLYNEIKSKYMKDSVYNLDRHKVAAIAIVTILKLDIIKPAKDTDDEMLFIGKELVATEVALSIMCELLNDKLSAIGYQKKIDAYYMPEAMSCNTPYILIFVRNLIYAKNDYVLNPLDLAEKLFLLETISLLKYDINPNLLAENRY